MLTKHRMAACISIVVATSSLSMARAAGDRADEAAFGIADTRAAMLDSLSAPHDAANPGRFVVQLDGPPSLDERAALEATGLALQTYIGDNTWFARTANSGAARGSLMTVVSLVSAEPIGIDAKLHRALRGDTPPAWAVVCGADAAGASTAIAACVLFHPDVQGDAAWNVIENTGGVVQDELISLNGMVVVVPFDAIASLAAEPDVMYIEPLLPMMTPALDSVRQRTGAEIVQAPPYSLDGAGVTVMVLDGGASSETHADIVGRVTVMDGATKIAHATHVAGIIAGDGTASTVAEPNAAPLKYRGMAPAATVLSYSIGGFAEGVPPEGLLFLNEPRTLEADMADAIAHGAVVGNASLALNVSQSTSIVPCDVMGDYTVVSGIIDSIVRGGLGTPLRSIWGAGNERGLPACGDMYATIPPPHAAKNHITVGAINANDDSMTDFSSWGPTDDGRLKPDFVAPGCRTDGYGGIVSAWAFDDFDYYVLCGTSMAAPAVTGLSALLIEDYRTQYPGRELPRNAMLKAMFAHTAVDLGNAGPDYQFGYGSVRIQPTIELMRAGAFWEGTLSQDDSYSRVVAVGPNDPELKATIAWDDYPAFPNAASALVNDLDLVVTSPTGVRHHPWTLDPNNPAAAAIQTAEDHLNNIEQVFVANPEAGDWTISVVGTNVPMGPQPFAIVGDGAAQAGIAIDFPAGIPDGVAPGLPNTMQVGITAAGETIVPGSANAYVRVNGGAFQALPLVALGGDLYEMTLPTVLCGDVVDFYVSVEGTATGVVTLPATAPVDFYSPEVGQMTIVFEDDFETDQGWTTSDNGATAGYWERDVPLPPGGIFDHGPETDGDGSGQCYLTDNSAGLSDVDNGGVILTSPVINLSGQTSEVSFWFYLYSNSTAGDDTVTMEISANGAAGPWLEVYRHYLSTEPIWFRPKIRWSQLAGAGFTPSANAQIRFIVSDSGAAGTVEGAIDGVFVSTFACTTCPGDLDGDSSVTSTDLSTLLGNFGMVSGAEQADGDLDGDGDVDSTDLSVLLGVFGASCD